MVTGRTHPLEWSGLMPKPESVEALLAPSLRVSRPVAACARCRSAKIKCDGKLPACSACERSGKASSCTSANDEFARGKERSYVAALEAAAQRLQRKIDAAKSEADSAPTALRNVASPLRRPSRPRKVSGSRRREASDVNELVSDFGFLTVNATSRDFQGFTSTMSFAKIMLAMATKSDFSAIVPSKLPPRHAIIQSIERYLQRIFVTLPFFSETEFMSSVSRVYQDASTATDVTPLDFWYIRLVLAISNATLSQTKGDQHDREAVQHMAAAMELADYVLHPGSVAGVQALLLLVEYALVDAAHFDSWYLIGMASRLMVDLGLHCEPSAETKISRDALDMRRRIFHSTYALDRLISMSRRRPFSFTDDSATGVPLPDYGQDQEQQPPSQLFLRSLKPSLYLFDIRRVQSAFYQTTRSSSRAQWSMAQAATYTSSVSGDINSWYSTVPMSLAPEHQVFFNLERLYCQILVVAPNQKVPIVNMTDLNKALVFEYSVQYADELHPVTRDIGYHAFMTHADLCRAQWVGKQFLEVMWSDFDRLLKNQHVMVGNAENASGPLENCSRAISCLCNITEILDFASRRWNMPEMREKFEQESAVLLGRLRNRQQEFSSPQYAVSNPSHAHQSPEQQYGHSSIDAGQPYQYNISPPLPTQSVMLQSLQHPGLGTGNDSENLSITDNGDQGGNYNFPQGSLPRRSYEFFGGRG